MKACFFRRHGGPEVLEYGELPDPRPADREILVSASPRSSRKALLRFQRSSNIRLPRRSPLTV